MTVIPLVVGSLIVGITSAPDARAIGRVGRGAIVFFIERAKKGRPIYVRKIAGLEAVNEAIGRATEMGRSIALVMTLRNGGRLPVAWVRVLNRPTRGARSFASRAMADLATPQWSSRHSASIGCP